MSVGNNIKVLRQGIGLTQKDLADQLNVSFQSISKWEKDEVEPDIGMLTKLSKLFDVSLDELINSSFSSISAKSDVTKEEKGANRNLSYNGEILKTEKPNGIKWFKIAGIITAVLGFLNALIGGLAYGEDGGTHAIIHSGDNTSVINSDIDFQNGFIFILGIIFCALGVGLIVFGALVKKDYLIIENQSVSGFAENKQFTYKWEDIKEAKAMNTSLKLLTKNNDKPMIVFFIKNPEKFAKTINEVIK